MTIAIAWIRQLSQHQELWFVSDSRLSGDGRLFDSCPKILMLPRNDCAIAYSGYTGDAFPMMLQLSLAIDSYNAAKSSELKLSALKEHAIQVFNVMAETIKSSVSPPQDETPTAQFLFGGYSWFRKSFQLWRILFSPEMTFVAHSIPWVGYRPEFKSVGWQYTADSNADVKKICRIGIIGDAPQITRARQLLSKRIKQNANQGVYILDMEPFEVVRDMLRDANSEGTIGGAPQAMVVHQYMQVSPVGVYWPTKNSNAVFIQGRRTLDYENINRYILDPDTLELSSPYRSKKPFTVASTSKKL